MVWPKYVPILSESDFHCNLNDYNVGRKRCIIGWLQKLFLYSKLDGDVVITYDDNAHYKQVVKLLSKHADIHTVSDMSPKKQAAIYLQVIKELGYNE